MASEIRVNQIQNRSGLGTVTFSDAGLSVSGILTATTFSGNLTGNVTGTVSSSGIATFSNGIIVAAGTTAAPSISPSGDSNTGIFFPSADTVAIGEGGIEALRVDSSGRVGVGTDIPSNKFELVGSDGTLVNIKRTGGTSVYQLMGNTDNNLGYIGYETKEFVFYPNNTKTVGITTNTGIKLYNGAGIDFSASSNAAGMTSELLSDYEEGTWTPTTNGATLTVNHARYRRIGSLVYVTCSLDVTVGGSNEASHIYGLPFSVDSSTGNNYVATESRRIDENPTLLYSIGYAASSIANKYVGRQFTNNQISSLYADSTSTGQPYGSASWQINVTGVRLVVYGWYVAA